MAAAWAEPQIRGQDLLAQQTFSQGPLLPQWTAMDTQQMNGPQCIVAIERIVPDVGMPGAGWCLQAGGPMGTRIWASCMAVHLTSPGASGGILNRARGGVTLN